MRRLIPVLLALLGLAAGLGAGFVLRPAPPADAAATDLAAAPPPGSGLQAPATLAPRPEGAEVVRVPNQFLIPLIGEGRVRAMVVLAVALELAPGHGLDMQRDEPRLRALFLQVLFDHANLGGFDGVFTSGEQLLALRRTLLETARSEFGSVVHDVLIVDLVRQES
jgi:flagellar protein FliL